MKFNQDGQLPHPFHVQDMCLCNRCKWRTGARVAQWVRSLDL